MSRRSWLAASLALPLSRAFANPSIAVAYDGDTLRPLAPNLHFLAGKPFDRLRDSAEAVTFYGKLSLYALDQTYPIRETVGRLTVSYDIWEEKFQVVMAGATPRTKSGLTAAQAEAWCMDNFVVSASGLTPDRPFYLRFEMWAPPPRDLSNLLADPGLSVRAFLELLSRKTNPGDPHWGPYDSGPRRLTDLVRTPGRGARPG